MLTQSSAQTDEPEVVPAFESAVPDKPGLWETIYHLSAQVGDTAAMEALPPAARAHILITNANAGNDQPNLIKTKQCWTSQRLAEMRPTAKIALSRIHPEPNCVVSDDPVVASEGMILCPFEGGYFLGHMLNRKKVGPDRFLEIETLTVGNQAEMKKADLLLAKPVYSHTIVAISTRLGADCGPCTGKTECGVPEFGGFELVTPPGQK
jgi:hypothetical protein